MRIQTLVTGFATMLLLFSNGFTQTRKCEGGGYDKSVKYKVLSKDIDTATSEIFLEVYLDPSKFAVDPMIRLVQRLKAEFCAFANLSFRFYDVKKVDRLPDPVPNPLLDWESKTPFRGFYDLKRNENHQELSFRSVNAKYVTSIIFKPDGYCVSETASEGTTLPN